MAGPGSAGLAGAEGCRDAAIPGLLTARREERSRRRQSFASCLATPLQISILSENVFFPAIGMGFTGAGSGLADQVVLRSCTAYLEGLPIRFGQVPATQPGMG